MKINLITPAKKHSKNGNRTSAKRWAGLLRDQGHRVTIHTAYDGSACDLMIALHAWRSAQAVERYRQSCPDGPLIVALGGTDVNSFLKSDPDVTLACMEKADALVCLHDQIGELLPAHLLPKLHVIVQSARPLAGPRRPAKRFFDVCVIGHLRREKDPLRTALAARLLPATSKIRIIHLGKAHNAQWADAARREQAANPRYHWRGEVSGGQVRREFVKTRLMVLTSNQEGGANVISEAIVAGVPVIASNIAGNTGLLGKTYPGLFAVGDERALADLLIKAETDPVFLDRLEQAGAVLRKRFLPLYEAVAWQGLIAELESHRKDRS
ncbi:MAG: TIGR04348 family glycosyltransferase [Rhodospirillales bacterium]|nr:TIGR04348 family glycosyltransferase [Rhodospirillales bacterium]